MLFGTRLLNRGQSLLIYVSSKRYPSRLESRAGFFASTRDECLSPRVRLECNPEIPVAPGEEHWLLDTIDLLLQPLDLGDILVELGDLGLEDGVTVLLSIDIATDDQVHQQAYSTPQESHQPKQRKVLLAPLPAALLAVRQKVDTNHASILRMARPQATIRAGASERSALGRTFAESVIPGKGMAAWVVIRVRPFTPSAKPGITAHPPDNTM